MPGSKWSDTRLYIADVFQSRPRYAADTRPAVPLELAVSASLTARYELMMRLPSRRMFASTPYERLKVPLLSVA